MCSPSVQNGGGLFITGTVLAIRCTFSYQLGAAVSLSGFGKLLVCEGPADHAQVHAHAHAHAHAQVTALPLPFRAFLRARVLHLSTLPLSSGAAVLASVQ